MKFLAAIFILAGNYYTFSYGKSLWVDDRNKLGAVGAILLAFAGSVLSIYILFIKNY